MLKHTTFVQKGFTLIEMMIVIAIIGIFCGGALGGFLYGHLGSTPIFMLGLGLAVIWFTLSLVRKKSCNETAIEAQATDR